MWSDRSLRLIHVLHPGIWHDTIPFEHCPDIWYVRNSLKRKCSQTYSMINHTELKVLSLYIYIYIYIYFLRLYWPTGSQFSVTLYCNFLATQYSCMIFNATSYSFYLSTLEWHDSGQSIFVLAQEKEMCPSTSILRSPCCPHWWHIASA